MSTVDKLLAVEAELGEIFLERKEAIRGLILTTLSGTNLLLLGPAGIAKSALVKAWNQRILGGEYFAWCLNNFTTPDEVFGPYSLEALRHGAYKRETKKKLARATTGFLDEIFKSNSSLLNTLLTILNERVFYNDGIAEPTPLISVVGASNEVPGPEDHLEALFDRFLYKIMLVPIHESGNFVSMLKARSIDSPPQRTITLEDIHEAMQQVNKVVIPEHTYDMLVRLRDVLRREGIYVSDRTYKVALRICKADAFLRKMQTVENISLEVFRHICWTTPTQAKTIYTTILGLIAPEKQKIQTLFDDCVEQSKIVYNSKDAAVRQKALIESNTKMRSALVEIDKLINAMREKQEDIADFVELRKNLVNLITNMTRDTLGLSERPTAIPKK